MKSGPREPNGRAQRSASKCTPWCTHPRPIEGRCNAHNKRRSKLCAQHPLTGKHRCRLHGAKGGAPSGPRNGNWKHGATVRKIVPLNAEEEKLLATYMTEGYKILEQVAHSKLLERRALGYALESGDLKIALEAQRTVASVAGEGKRIAEGAVVRVVFDETVVEALVEKFIDVIGARIPDRALVALVAQDLTAVDWSKVALPALTETAAAAVEKS